MRRAARIIGRILLVLAGLLIAAGLMTWPPGGLTFALPFAFLMPGALFGLVGGILLWLGRRPHPDNGTDPGAS